MQRLPFAVVLLVGISLTPSRRTALRSARGRPPCQSLEQAQRPPRPTHPAPQCLLRREARRLRLRLRLSQRRRSLPRRPSPLRPLRRPLDRLLPGLRLPSPPPRECPPAT